MKLYVPGLNSVGFQIVVETSKEKFTTSIVSSLSLKYDPTGIDIGHLSLCVIGHSDPLTFKGSHTDAYSRLQ